MAQDSSIDLPTLAAIEHQLSQQTLPPVAQWNPQVAGSMDLCVRRDGSWWYQGSQIKRERMVRLFSTILRREPDNRYVLVTPVEKLFIEVEDAPFVATSIDVFGATTEMTLTFETNVGDRVIVDSDHHVYLEYDETDHPSPYVVVREGLPALLSRSVYYQMVDVCTTHADQFGFWSRNVFNVLADADV